MGLSGRCFDPDTAPFPVAGGVDLFGDSGTLCSFLNRRARIKEENIFAIVAHLMFAIQRYPVRAKVQLIDRSLNYAADRLADQATSLTQLLRKYNLGNCSARSIYSLEWALVWYS